MHPCITALSALDASKWVQDPTVFDGTSKYGTNVLYIQSVGNASQAD